MWAVILEDLMTRSILTVALAAGSSLLFAQTDVPRLPAGAYRITAEKEGFAPATVSVQVSPGAVAAVEIELKPAP